MAVRAKGTIALTRGVPVTLFEETIPANLPGIYGGEVDLTQLLNIADEINIRRQTKYDTGSPFRNAQTNTYKRGEDIYQLTPVEASFGHKLTIELLSVSPSATANLEFVITRNNA